MKKRNLALGLFLSFVMLSTTFLTLSAAATFGQTTPGNNSAWQNAGTMVGSRFTANLNNPTSISVYVTQSSSPNTARCAIYSESNKQLLTVTEEKTIPLGFNGWMTFNFGSSPSIASGSSYSLVIWFKNAGSFLRYSPSNTATTWYASQPYTGAFPTGPYNSIKGYGQENNAYSIYCTSNSVTPTTQTTQPSTTPTPLQSGGTKLGQTNIGNYFAWQPANTMVSSRFKASSTGNLNAITAYMNNGASASNSIKFAVYSDTNKALVGISQEITIPGKASGWFTASTTSSPSIVAGQTYSIVIWLKNANCYLPYSYGTSSQSWYTQATYGNFPANYYSNGQENTVYSIYATIGTTSNPTSPTIVPTPTPTSTPTITPSLISSSPNLAPILGKWGDYHIFGDVCYGNPSTYQQITHADFAVTHNGKPSVRVDGPGIPDNGAREVNHRWISVKPGDRIVFSAWIKTNPSSIGEGGTIAFDAYGPNERIMEVHPRTIQSEIWNGGARPTGWSGMGGSVIYVPYGRDWTKVTLDVTIPYTTFTHNDWQQPLQNGPQQIVGITPMLSSSWRHGESASIWYSDAELYINP